MTALITLILSSKPARAIGGLLALLAAWWGNSALQRRKGRLAERKEAAARDAQGHKDTTERMQDADADLPDDPGVLRDWLRDRNSDQR